MIKLISCNPKKGKAQVIVTDMDLLLLKDDGAKKAMVRRNGFICGSVTRHLKGNAHRWRDSYGNSFAGLNTLRVLEPEAKAS